MKSLENKVKNQRLIKHINDIYKLSIFILWINIDVGYVFSELSYDSNLLPHEDDYIGQDISIFKNTFIIRNVEPFTFCYYTCCNKCIDDYIKIYNSRFKYIMSREIGKKFKDRKN